MKPLQSFRVIELGNGPVTGLAGMVLADFGADVIKIDPPGGDPFGEMPASFLWTRGKRRLTVDLGNSAELDELRCLITNTADGVMTTLRKQKRESLRLDSKTLQESRPDLVYGSVSGFGEKGPYAHYPGYEGLVAAKSGRMIKFAGVADRPGPNFSALQVGIHATSQTVVSGMLASLECRRKTGIGLSFETSLLRGMIPYEMGVSALSQLYDKGIVQRPQRERDRSVSMPTLNYHPVRTSDGKWLQLGNLLPHLLDNFFRASGFDYVFTDPKYQGDPFRWDREVLEQFRDDMFEHMQTRTANEWMDHYVEDGEVAAHPYQTSQEALSDPDVVMNGHVVTKGETRQLGLVANLTETPGEVGAAIKDTTFLDLQNRKPASIPVANGSPILPLEGVTIVESATIIAAPLGASTLSDLGARVIKIEPLTGDPFRGMMRALGASKCNVGKESICIDLKSHEGQAIAHKLAGRADIWLHNYRVGVPEKLGIGYQELSELNPGLIYISANGYGPNGPGAKRPSTHPVPGAALGGVVWQIGAMPDPERELNNAEMREMARKLLRANEVNPDPNTSMVIATTAILGLCARSVSGKGQKIFLDMFGANAYANWDDFFSYPDKPPRPNVDSNGFGLGPLYRLYEAQDGWIFLAAVTPKEKQLLAQTLILDIENENLESRLECLFKTKSVAEWETELTRIGIGCVEASGPVPPQFFMVDEHVAQEGILVEATHPDWGTYKRLGPMSVFDNGSYGGTEAAGGSTTSLLKELGYDGNEISELVESNVVRAS
ncbi:MAG: CoA transferase [Gammaproteobacteria bacterium]|nr:CoA transferase [Gammaproteobacteria bacterium]